MRGQVAGGGAAGTRGGRVPITLFAMIEGYIEQQSIWRCPYNDCNQYHLRKSEHHMMKSIELAPLFTPGEAADPSYCNLRRAESKYARAGKDFAQRLWRIYHPYADSHFLTEIRRDFHARFWEMYLTCALMEGARDNYKVSCPKSSAGLSRYIRHYNGARPHSSLAGRTPDEVYHQPTLSASAGLAQQTLAAIKLAA